MALNIASKRSVASYFLDWVALAAMGLICYGLNKITPVYHPFSLLDLNIAFPMRTELVSTASLIIASVIGPGAIMAAVSLFLVPGPGSIRTIPWQQQLVRKIWEINVAWLGLGLSELTALLLTTGLKNIIGKPRPDLLSRCNPDLNTIQQHLVGGITGNISPAWVLVDQGICQQQDMSILNDGFRSFPSGHSSTSWAGLLYLGLYLCAKFGVAFPHLPPVSRLASLANGRDSRRYRGVRNGDQSLDAERKPIFGASSSALGRPSPFVGRRREGAAPPAYLQFLLYIPVGVALFICSSRWFDYRHHGFDIISGSVIGIFTSWYAFNTYHMPLGRGAGWSWGPRSRGRAFGIGVGTDGWVSEEDEENEALDRDGPSDMEMGTLRDHSPAAAHDAGRSDISNNLSAPGFSYADQYGPPGSAH